jgi:hypothetical protein
LIVEALVVSGGLAAPVADVEVDVPEAEVEE